MDETAIIVEDIWKQYRLGVINGGTFKQDLSRWWKTKVRHQEDPLLVLNENGQPFNNGQSFHALQDINLKVKKGEVLGIIGKNGAGKSTLLKILTRVTKPSRGSIRGTGRVASLLEVATGFHEELTSMENIFLNGNILGMTNKEIRAKLDQIIAFSGV